MRVPRPQPGQLKWWVIGAIGIGGGIALAIWFGLAASVGLPSWETYGYKVVDDQTVTVTFDVTRPEGRPLTCTVHAIARDFATVGTIDVQVPQSVSETSRETVTVRTTSRAVTGEVQTCTMP